MTTTGACILAVGCRLTRGKMSFHGNSQDRSRQIFGKGNHGEGEGMEAEEQMRIGSPHLPTKIQRVKVGESLTASIPPLSLA